MSESASSHLTMPVSRAVMVGWRAALMPLGTFLVVLVLATDHGGYYPTAWGWAALVLAWVAGIAFVLRDELALGRLEIVSVGALSLFTCWVALSTTWTVSVTSTVREIERDVLFPIGLLAALVVVRRATVSRFLWAIWAAITIVCWYALATRVFPDQVSSFNSISVYRLKRPVGYWNALGLLSAMGVLLALGFATHAARSLLRAVASMSLVVLLPTLYFTYGRGAWIAFGCAIVFLLVIHPRRLQLATTIICCGAPAVVAVLIASRLTGLTRVGSSLAVASHDGHRLVAALIPLAVAAAGLSFARDVVGARAGFGDRGRRVYAWTLVLATAAAAVLLLVHFGGPAQAVRSGWRSFNGPPVGTTNLNSRLFNLSSNGRIDMWRLAWRDYVHHPVLGSGAGTYEWWYLSHRPTNMKVKDAHGLYIETLAELGPIGLALLLIALLAPLVAAFRARRQDFVPFAAAAYLAFLLHAGVDWDWEVAGITLTGIFCGAALLVAARGEGSVRRTGKVGRIVGITAASVVIGFSLLGLLGNVPASRAGDAIFAGNWNKAAAEARKMIRWMPWSSEGWLRRGQAEVGKNQLVAAERDLTRAISMDPRNWDLWFDLALATSGRTQRHALEQALSLNPRSPEVAEFIAGVGLKGIKPVGGKGP